MACTKTRIRSSRWAPTPRSSSGCTRNMTFPPTRSRSGNTTRAGAIVDSGLAKGFGWKLGDHIFIQGVKFPLDLELTIRGIFRSALPIPVVYFNWKYVETRFHRGKDEIFLISADSVEHVAGINRGR